MNVIYITSQIAGFIAFALSLIAYHQKEKKKIFQTMMVANILDIIHYILLDAYSGFITKIIALIRNEIIIVKEKNKKFNNLIVLIALFIIYLVSCVSNIISLIALFLLFLNSTNVILIWINTANNTTISIYIGLMLALLVNSISPADMNEFVTGPNKRISNYNSNYTTYNCINYIF